MSFPKSTHQIMQASKFIFVSKQEIEFILSFYIYLCVTRIEQMHAVARDEQRNVVHLNKSIKFEISKQSQSQLVFRLSCRRFNRLSSAQFRLLFPEKQSLPHKTRQSKRREAKKTEGRKREIQD